MTTRQKKFVNYYIKTNNATEAYIKAGYKVKDRNVAKTAGNRLLTNVDIKQYINKRLEKVDKESIASADEVLEYFSKVLRGEIRDIAIIDNEEKEIAPSITERTKCAKELAKRYGIDKPDANKENEKAIKAIKEFADALNKPAIDSEGENATD